MSLFKKIQQLFKITSCLYT